MQNKKKKVKNKNKIKSGIVSMVEQKQKLYRTLTWDIIQLLFEFQHFHDHTSVEHDEKLSHTKFDMNWFMVD